MNERPTPETEAETMQDEYDHVDSDLWPFAPSDTVPAEFARKLERERDEAREALREWQTLRLWGAEPQHIHDFIKGQQTRIHECQDIEKTCEQLERERDEALTELEMWRDGNILHEIHRDELEKAERERDQAREKCASWIREWRSLRVFCKQLDEDANDRLRERDEAREELQKTRKFLRDANLGAEINARINNSLAGELIELRRERDEARELVKAYQEYTKLLGDEINDMTAVAYVHGWRTNRYEEGKVLRDKIKRLEETK